MDTQTAQSRPSLAAVDAVRETLLARFGNRAVTSQAVRQQHANTLTWAQNQPPDIVVYPESTQEVSEIVTLCAAHRVPVIPFGDRHLLRRAHVNAPFGGVSIDTSMMKAVLAVHAEDLDCVVEPGVTRKQLNEHLRDQGLFFPIDPGADASLGGMAATRASGTNAVRYGTMKDNVLSLTVVLPDGAHHAARLRAARKSSAGYDLTRLFVGSEGTLGVITEVTLRLHGMPEAISAAVCPFPVGQGRMRRDHPRPSRPAFPVARIELADATQVKAINLYSKLGLPEAPMLFMEFHGTQASVEEQADRFGEIAADLGGGPFEWATKAGGPHPPLAGAARRVLGGGVAAAGQQDAGHRRLRADLAAGRMRRGDAARHRRDRAHRPHPGPCRGRQFPCRPLVDMDDPDEIARIEGFLERLVERALSMEGTCTGEHGVGQSKIKYLEREHDPGALDMMRTLKRSLDPLNIINPGKIVRL